MNDFCNFREQNYDLEAGLKLGKLILGKVWIYPASWQVCYIYISIEFCGEDGNKVDGRK